MIRYFITATGTDVGKTFVTAALAHMAVRSGLSVLALKPIASGFAMDDWAHSDSGVLLRAQGLDSAELERISPWRFAAPLSPDMAAAREGKRIDVESVTQFCREALSSAAEMVLIEGVGGVMVPLDDTLTVLDWMKSLGVPVILVAGSYLGSISHTLTAIEVLVAAKLSLRALVLDESRHSNVVMDDTARALRRFVPDLPIIQVGRRDGATPWSDVPELAPLLA